MAQPAALTATGHDLRVDLRWAPAAEATAHHVYRAATAEGPFERITADVPHRTHVFSDFGRPNGQEQFYKVTAVREGAEGPPSPVVSATPREMTDDELLTSVQEATFRYFWDYARPVSGLAREGTDRAECTIGGTGFGLMALVVGAERGFEPRDAVAQRVLAVVTFLDEKAQRFHGVWSHWVDGESGAVLPFSPLDDGADLVETAFLVQGLLTARQYFGGESAVESEIRARCTRLWEGVDWAWHLKHPDGKRLFWHWSPNHGWAMNHTIGGHFNECHIVYLLAIASPTHPIPPECYYEGWTGEPPTGYLTPLEQQAMGQRVGWPEGGPLFFTHYSYLGFDPRVGRDRYCSYFENNRAIALRNRAHCIGVSAKHAGYGEGLWGLTASLDPDGYRVHEPRDDNGTIAPTAALSSMPYTPDESMQVLRSLYHTYGARLWGEFGFRDALNLDRNWVAPGYLAIDQGPIVAMIENHRTQLCWRLFMSNAEIPRALDAIGWQAD